MRDRETETKDGRNNEREGGGWRVEGGGWRGMDINGQKTKPRQDNSTRDITPSHIMPQ